MNIVLFTRDFCILAMRIIIGIPLFFIAIRVAYKYKDSRVKCTIVVMAFYVMFALVPYQRIISAIPFKFDTVEKAVKFDFADRYQIMYKKRYKNTYFIAAKDRKQPYFIFTSYKKAKNGWKSFIQPPNLHITKIKCKDLYEIHYLNNQEDEVTGIFIESFQSENAKDSLNEKTIVSDKYNTPFTYIKSKDGLPIKKNIKVKSFPIPFRKQKIIEEYSQ